MGLGSASLALPTLGSRLSPGEKNSPYVDAHGPPIGFGPPGVFFTKNAGQHRLSLLR
jgi:hypothetical protein